MIVGKAPFRSSVKVITFSVLNQGLPREHRSSIPPRGRVVISWNGAVSGRNEKAQIALCNLIVLSFLVPQPTRAAHPTERTVRSISGGRNRPIAAGKSIFIGDAAEDR